MDVWQLKVFLAVMEHSSGSKAAARLNLSPAAVSAQCHRLAADLDVELFVRSGTRLIPTPAALQLAERARVVVREMHDIEQEFANNSKTDRRPFYFGTSATMLIHHLGRPLRLLRKQYPNNPMEITVAGTDEMVAALLDRRLDLALISVPGENSDLTLLPLFDEEMLILKPAPTRVRGWHVGSIEPADLAQAQFILYPKRSVLRRIADNFFREVGLTPRVAMEADDAQAIKRLVEAGFGYAILPEYALRGQLGYFGLFRVPGHRIVRSQALATARSEHPRALTETIARFLREALVTAR
jgi:DNA-binding transcriptional LysR family regulator